MDTESHQVREITGQVLEEGGKGSRVHTHAVSLPPQGVWPNWSGEREGHWERLRDVLHNFVSFSAYKQMLMTPTFE